MAKVYTIYALVDAEGKYQYIGCTQDVRARKYQHQYNRPTLEFRELETIIGRRGPARERELIIEHQPPLNVMHTPRQRCKPRKAGGIDNRPALAMLAHL